MIIIDNVHVLRSRDQELLNNVSQFDSVIDTLPYEVKAAKNGQPNLYVKKEDKLQAIHSQYDPGVEAEKFVGQFLSDELEEYEHIFFYGLGMGYHVDAFMRRFPEKSFTIYEPDGCLFYHYLSQRKLNDLPLHRLKKIYVEFTPDFLGHHLQDFLKTVQEKVFFVVLPSYERIYKEQYERFFNEFRNAVSNTRSSLHVNIAFEKRWVINSYSNFPHVLKTANILSSKRHVFENKPAIIVSAGPSLEDEIEQLRKIKEQGIAYIFAVGSSIKALLKNNIYPDAVCSYDPQHNTVETYTQIVEENITDIPLVYGTSVGFETVATYPGPKLHMVTNQDTVASLYLKQDSGQPVSTVSDAPSIAVVTLEMLYKLGANPIILVGQNFAYKNNQFYASGIDYQTPSQQRPTVLSEVEAKGAIEVEDVKGDLVYTNNGFNRMRIQMEAYTSLFTDREIINTTQGGAKIANTTFALLEDLMENRLKERIVDSNWYEAPYENTYNLEFSENQRHNMEAELKRFYERMHKLVQVIQDLKQLLDHKDEKRLLQIYPVFDKEYKRFMKNKFFETILLPMNRVEHEILARNVTAIRFETDVFLKSRKIIDIFGHFIYQCQREINMMEPLIQLVHNAIHEAQDNLTKAK